MSLFQVKNYSGWSDYEGSSEGSGRSEKKWLISPSGEIGLFKFPKSELTYEHVSEHMAHQIGEIVNVPTAVVELGKYNGRMGSMSYLIRKSDEILIEGAQFILGMHPNYDLDKMQDLDTQRYYSIDHIFEITENTTIRNFWIEMMLFDFLIGNSDRHQNNWAFLLSTNNKTRPEIRFCPLYDNGSSLCCYVNDDQIEKYSNEASFTALADTRSKSIIRIDGGNKTRPTHRDVVTYLFDHYGNTKEIAKGFLYALNGERIQDLLNRYPDYVLPEQRKRLIFRFLQRKLDILRSIGKGEEYANS